MINVALLTITYMAAGALGVWLIARMLKNKKIISGQQAEHSVLLGAFIGLVLFMAVSHVQANSGEPLTSISSPEQFDTLIDQNPRPIVIKFHARWCGACRVFAPTVKQARDSWQGKVDFYSVDVDIAPDLARRYSVEALPTLVVINNGSVAARVTGVQNYDQLDELLYSVTADPTHALLTH